MHTTSRRNFLVLTGISALAAAGCGTAAGSSSRNTDKLRYQGSSGAVTPPELAADLGYLGDLKLDWVGNTISGPQDIQSAASGQTDFGGAFNGAVVKLAARKAPIKAVISYYGSDKYAYSGFYVAENSAIRSPRDLIGKKAGMNTLGAHAEAMLDIYLKKNGLSRAEAERVERIVVPPVNTEQSLRQRQIDVAVLGGILRDKALETGGVRKLFSDFDLRGAFSAGTYILTDRFIKQNPETVRTFVTGVGKALDWSRTTSREEVVARMTEIVAKRKRSESADALKYWRSYGVSAPGGRIAETELSVWADWLTERGDVKSGQVHVEDLYTNEYNDIRATKAS
ncbi:ABC transporter substrate-binding protein [Streptomyces lunaelactis]|uniref:ABC transporter substrate-binding protein n=1 Tax=Streptomyces lunaelactis TaxID=1535768 RepID=UPI001584E242|nr:ABC transporter substrate-binding protein [Streptomyces lunaelactis]NUJ99636.1 ABC transporter substrate-binding protein [Streptomyces lunaelactis]NUK12656.1 ABC transporter substrate-binding protein [Streptomyces lunaelactis]NUK20571.1 ABC transporter substrate-binding protein [Streptomyces lunaelactis]NUK28007.1 ABC transporter substrate-binding protein [Streptomyces lunaelactis]NUK38999.1 ABC transporter substrate-binding protein [Streptomyces lunaelactis]